MRGVALWVLLTSIAFLATAAAFLLLASLGGYPESAPIPRADPSESQERPALSLRIPEDRLEELEREPGQRLTLDLENGGEEELVDVNLTLDVLSENTARPHARSYRETLERLAPDETASVEHALTGRGWSGLRPMRRPQSSSRSTSPHQSRPANRTPAPNHSTGRSWRQEPVPPEASRTSRPPF